MKRILCILFIMLICTAVFSQQRQRIQIRNIAVVETQIDDRSGASADINKAEVAEITNEIRREAVRHLPRKRFNVMTAETVLSMGDAVLAECVGENCVITLGSKIGADYIVRGVISKFRNDLTLTVEIFETEYGMLVATADPVRTMDLGEFLKKTTEVCAVMYKEFLETAPITMIPDRKQMASAPTPAPPTPVVPPVTYTLAVARSPVAGGTVSRHPNQPNYVSGTSVTLRAMPVTAFGYRFIGWSGVPKGVDSTKAEITFPITNHTKLTANFIRTYSVTYNINPTSGGTVSLNPDQTYYYAGTPVTLTAIPNAGYVFSGWTRYRQDGFISKDSMLTNSINNDLWLTAHFSKQKTLQQRQRLKTHNRYGNRRRCG